MKLLIIGIGIGMILVSVFHATSIKADIRSKYMDLGDKYLKMADNCPVYAGSQSYGVLALAAYTAAQKE